MRTFADNRLHVDSSIVCQFQHGGKGFSFFGGKAVQQDVTVFQQFNDFFIIHLPIADDTVDVQYTSGIFSYVILTAVPLTGLHYIAATQWTATDNFLLCFHTF
ncbi:hypothetical protein EVA_10427 [gut metagenome]|uniref:Uncharacterized protein n=1 Tax=gut metagenome TaxID=749906 RepID=J9G2L0_9ZZZZ